MAYDLHIERADETPIALSEWRAAIEATEGVRLFAAAAHTSSQHGMADPVPLRGSRWLVPRA